MSQLFSIPLESFLYHFPTPELRRSLHFERELDPAHAPTSEVSGPSDWHTCRDIYWLGGCRFRRHTFWDNRNPVRGLTRYVGRAVCGRRRGK